jgi:phage terminase small subunit
MRTSGDITRTLRARGWLGETQNFTSLSGNGYQIVVKNGQMSSNKEKVWLEEYLKCFNASEAARRAGYKWPNRIGTRKLAKFADEIKARIAEKAMSADEVLLRLAEMARGEAGDYLLGDGSIDYDQLIADGKAHLIKKIYKTSRITKDDEEILRITVEVYDAQRALELIGKHHKLFTDQANVNVSGAVQLIGIDPDGDAEQ